METTSTSVTSTLPTAPAVVREQPGGDTMRAIILKGFGGLDSLVYTDIPRPLTSSSVPTQTGWTTPVHPGRPDEHQHQTLPGNHQRYDKTLSCVKCRCSI